MKICLSLLVFSPLLADAYSYYYQPATYSYYAPRSYYGRKYSTNYGYQPQQLVKSFTAFNNQATSFLRQAPAPSSCTSAFCQRFGFNLAEKVRFEWDRQQPKIEAMARNPRTAPLIQEMVDANPCVDSLDAYDALIEVGVRYLEQNANEIEDSYMTILSLRGEKDMATLFDKYEQLYKQLDGVWSQVFSLKCQGSPDVFVKAVRDLAYVLDKMAKVEDIPGIQNSYVRENYDFAARALFGLASGAENFLRAQNDIDCNTAEPLRDWTELSAVAADEFANLMGNLGYYTNSKEIRQRSTFITSLAKTLENWPVQPPRGEACLPGKLERAGRYMGDIADFIRSSSLEELAVRYGVVFRIDLL